MKDLIILGKAPINKTVSQLRTDNNEIWMCGTDLREGADLYFELHNIHVKHNSGEVLYSIEDDVYCQHLPINNTISALLVRAYLLGYKNIKVLGCPMDSQKEYIEQKPSVAYICGFLTGKGLNVEWSNSPVNKDYGRKTR